MRTDVRLAWQSGGWFGVLDGLGHMLRLPHWLMGRVCDAYDRRIIGPQ